MSRSDRDRLLDVLEAATAIDEQTVTADLAQLVAAVNALVDSLDPTG